MDESSRINDEIQRLHNKIAELNLKIDNNFKVNLNTVWLDNQEACDLLRVTKRTLQIYRYNGLLPASRIRGKIYFRTDDIEAFLRRHYSTSQIIRRKKQHK
jgi:hypothetical protein